ERAPDANSVFEIGSITKTFTGIALAEMVQRKMVALEDPVRKYLPADAVPPGKAGEPEIRLIDLASQHSGLPRMPDNFRPKNQDNPYVDYTPKLLYEFLGKQTLRLKPDAGFLYSNLGLGLLGHALSLRYAKPYEQMIIELITTPLGMPDTRVTFTADMRNRLAPGHDGTGKPVGNWDLDAMAGAGALRSTATDMLRYAQAQFDPPAKLKSAIELAHVERHKIGALGTIALAWITKPDGKTTWHNGGTGGYTSYVSFNAERRTGVVVLVNSAGRVTDQIGDRLEHMLAGEPVQPITLPR
ncbi:MAG TPA: serine hydrolase domain-containing protein, partial [Candidatus Limnocylindrales bacterium]|nr:serine hydrolase domain-containing protein [Candidatus Limnocylindrales bacterium]